MATNVKRNLTVGLFGYLIYFIGFALVWITAYAFLIVSLCLPLRWRSRVRMSLCCRIIVKPFHCCQELGETGRKIFEEN